MKKIPNLVSIQAASLLISPLVLARYVQADQLAQIVLSFSVLAISTDQESSPINRYLSK